MAALQSVEQEHPGRAGTQIDEVFVRLPVILRMEGLPAPSRSDVERTAADAFRAGFLTAAPSSSEVPMTRFHSTDDFFDLIFSTLVRRASRRCCFSLAMTLDSRTSSTRSGPEGSEWGLDEGGRSLEHCRRGSSHKRVSPPTINLVVDVSYRLIASKKAIRGLIPKLYAVCC